MFLDRIKANAGLVGRLGGRTRHGSWRGIRSQAVKAVSAFAFLAAAIVPAAFGEGLERVGPVANNPGGNGYPTWYQDKTGVTLDFCSPTDQRELADGWCVLLAPDLPNGVPETFPNNFFDEHFYFLANATGTTTNGSPAKLVLALEGAFGGGPPAPNDQIVFARIRVVVRNLPKTGNYTVYHPYGTDTIPGVAGDRLFVTEDVGIECFACSTTGRFGPFLLASSSPGGPELPAVTGPTGRQYIAAPDRLGPITGSPKGQNYFRIVDPDGLDLLDVPVGGDGTKKITDFTLNGRLFTGAIPGRVSVDRAMYSSDPSRVDVFATVIPTLQARVPGTAKAPEATPQLQYYFGSCASDAANVLSAPPGQSAAGMRADGHHVWGQSAAPSGNPAQICVEDRSSSTFYGAAVKDGVTVTKAEYNPDLGQLSISASSTDRNATLEYNGTPLPNGNGTIVNVSAPPDTIQVDSNGRGSGAARLTTTPFSNAISVNDVLTAQSLNAVVAAGNSVSISVPNAAGNVVSIVTPPDPTKGKADVNAATNAIIYTALAGASGTDTFTYNIASTSGSVTSNTAGVNITINGPTAPPPPPPPPPPPGTVETITITAAQFRTDQNRWIVSGTDTLLANQTLMVRNATKGVDIGNAPVDATGAWALDIRGVSGSLIPAAGNQIVAIRKGAGPNGADISSPLFSGLTIRR